jgi:hypothetical protein
MDIVREYWENPEDPDDNGHVFICNTCGKHSSEMDWDQTHKCDPATLKEFKKWEKFYATEVE